MPKRVCGYPSWRWSSALPIAALILSVPRSGRSSVAHTPTGLHSADAALQSLSLVSIQSRLAHGGQRSCLGVAVSRYVVLTAKHCTAGAELVLMSSAQGFEIEGLEVRDHPALDLSLVYGGDFAWTTPLSARSSSKIALVAAQQTAGPLVPVAVRWLSMQIDTLSSNDISGLSADGPCTGDSGAPLLGADGTLLGILSRGAAVCARRSARNWYVPVGGSESWIRENLH